MIFLFALSAVLLSLASASPLHDSRQSEVLCGQYDTATVGQYSLLTDLWGESSGSGSQCSQIESASGDPVSWWTEWNWSGSTSIKSFSNIQLNEGINQQLSAINSMPSTWSWTQSNDGSVVADVAYDFFTSYSAGGSNVIEVMVWLANFNSGPISYSYDAEGQAVPIATSLDIDGLKWILYHGSNGQNQVYSFLPASGQTITDFSGDVMAFFNYLVNNQGVDSSLYLVTAQAGTEATSGSAKLTTSSYTLSIN